MNIWPLEGSGHAYRAALAEQAIVAYSPEGGLVVDFWPGDFEAVAAAAAAGRQVAALHTWGRALAIAGRVDLVLILPLARSLAPPDSWAMHPAETHGMAEQARRLLRPGGFLVLGIVPHRGADDLGAATAAATDAGLSYFQHVIALDRAELADRSDPRPVMNRVDVLVLRRPE